MAVNNISGASSSQIHSLQEHRVQQQGQGNQANPQGNGANPAAGSSDSVTLTGTAAQLRGLEQELSKVPVVDTQRVDSVKNEIASGTFQVNPTRVAEKMMQIEGLIHSR